MDQFDYDTAQIVKVSQFGEQLCCTQPNCFEIDYFLKVPLGNLQLFLNSLALPLLLRHPLWLYLARTRLKENLLNYSGTLALFGQVLFTQRRYRYERMRFDLSSTLRSSWVMAVPSGNPLDKSIFLNFDFAIPWLRILLKWWELNQLIERTVFSDKLRENFLPFNKTFVRHLSTLIFTKCSHSLHYYNIKILKTSIAMKIFESPSLSSNSLWDTILNSSLATLMSWFDEDDDRGWG